MTINWPNTLMSCVMHELVTTIILLINIRPTGYIFSPGFSLTLAGFTSTGSVSLYALRFARHARSLCGYGVTAYGCVVAAAASIAPATAFIEKRVCSPKSTTFSRSTCYLHLLSHLKPHYLN